MDDSTGHHIPLFSTVAKEGLVRGMHATPRSRHQSHGVFPTAAKATASLSTTTILQWTPIHTIESDYDRRSILELEVFVLRSVCTACVDATASLEQGEILDSSHCVVWKVLEVVIETFSSMIWMMSLHQSRTAVLVVVAVSSLLSF